MTSEKNKRILYPIIIIAVIILIIFIIKIPRRSVETKFQLTELVQEVSNTPVSVFGVKYYISNFHPIIKNNEIEAAFTLSGPSLGNDGVEVKVVGNLYSKNSKLYYHITKINTADQSRIRETAVNKVVPTYFNQFPVFGSVFDNISQIRIEDESIVVTYKKKRTPGIISGVVAVGLILAVMLFGVFAEVLNPLSWL